MGPGTARNQDRDPLLTEAEEIVSAIRNGEVDAFVIRSGKHDRVYTLRGADCGYPVLFETLNEGALTLSAEGTILYGNRRFADLVGLPLGQVLGSPFTRFVAPTDSNRFEALLIEGTQGGSRDEIRLTRADGGLITAGVSLNPVDVEHGTTVCTAVVTDLTELRQAQEALEIAKADLEVRVAERTAELTRANAALQEADRRKDEFLCTLAHELRNPLAPIQNSTQVLKLLGPKEPTLQHHREVIERQVYHLARLVDDLLDVSRISRGMISLRKAVVDLADVVGHAAEAVRPLVDSLGHELVVSLPEQPVWLEADAARLEQVLVNLLTNAAKYTVQAGRITLNAEQDGDHLVIRVRDTGMGISPELLPHVFDLFVQEERSLARSQGGLGIGLTLVKRMVEMHDGDIQAISAGSGQGSEFVLRLPGVSGPADLKPEATAEPGRAERGSARVLIVEDNPDSAETMADLVELWGHEVRIARTGQDALDAAATFRPAVMLCDLGLPDMDGYTVAQRLQQQTILPKTWLIALTGYGQQEDRQRTREAGFHAHLTKPVNPSNLEEILQSIADGKSMPPRTSPGD